MSALTPLRAKLKLVRMPCSTAAVKTTSLAQNARGWRKVPTTRYSLKPRPVPSWVGSSGTSRGRTLTRV